VRRFFFITRTYLGCSLIRLNFYFKVLQGKAKQRGHRLSYKGDPVRMGYIYESGPYPLVSWSGRL